MKSRFVLPLFCLGLSGYGAAQAELQAMVGKPVPAFSLKDTKGKAVTNKTILGKVVLLDFWATWCGPCKQASPTMQKLHTTYGSKGLMVIGANTSEEDSVAAGAAAKYAKEHRYSYTMTPKSDSLAEALHVQGLPTFILVDKKGKIQKVWVGYNPQRGKEIEAAVKAAIGGK